MKQKRTIQQNVPSPPHVHQNSPLPPKDSSLILISFLFGNELKNNFLSSFPEENYPNHTTLVWEGRNFGPNVGGYFGQSSKKIK